jgi:hypothetical protein
MSAIAVKPEYLVTPSELTQTTLLELVQAVSEVVEDEGEVVATIVDMLESGRARLVGSFRGLPAEVFARARCALD